MKTHRPSCNHCGRCCCEEVCSLGHALITRITLIEQPCPALIFQEGEWLCDLYRRPWCYNQTLDRVVQAAAEMADAPFLDRLSAVVRDQFEQTIGKGCDADFAPSELIPIHLVDDYHPLPPRYKDQMKA